eukprot:scaffold8451_cov30-Tisochrysis_lutea.AAC.1
MSKKQENLAKKFKKLILRPTLHLAPLRSLYLFVPCLYLVPLSPVSPLSGLQHVSCLMSPWPKDERSPRSQGKERRGAAERAGLAGGRRSSAEQRSRVERRARSKQQLRGRMAVRPCTAYGRDLFLRLVGRGARCAGAPPSAEPQH